MVGNPTYFNGYSSNVFDDAADICKNSWEVSGTHDDTRALNMEHQMNVVFYQCICHTILCFIFAPTGLVWLILFYMGRGYAALFTRLRMCRGYAALHHLLVVWLPLRGCI